MTIDEAILRLRQLLSIARKHPTEENLGTYKKEYYHFFSTFGFDRRIENLNAEYKAILRQVGKRKFSRATKSAYRKKPRRGR